MRHLVVALASALSYLLISQHACARDKTDVIIMRNGDQLTGQIVEVLYGRLSLKTDYMGTVEIEWIDIAGLQSPQHFIVQDLHGRHRAGSLLTNRATQHLLVLADDGRGTELPLDQVDRVYAGGPTVRERLTGSLSLGFDYARSSDITTLSGALDATYRGPTFLWTLSADVNTTKDPQQGTLDRDMLSFTYQRLLERHFIAGLSSAERHEQMGVEARLQLGAGIGKYLAQTARTEVSALIGGTFTREWATGPTGAEESFEAVLGLDWRLFQFTAPKTSLASSLLLYPSLTDSGRFRTTLNASLRRELFKDVYLDLSIYHAHDTDPPSETAEKSDYGVTSSLGYSF